jgi:hypothetical protein
MGLELQFGEYFATGQHQDTDWQNALLGRVPGSEPAVAQGFEYVKFPLRLLPQDVQDAMGTGPDFSIVSLRRSSDMQKKVNGTILRLTRRELALIGDWTLSDPEGPAVMLQPTIIGVDAAGMKRIVHTELTTVTHPEVEVVTNYGVNFFNGKADSLLAAQQIRTGFIARNPEDNNPEIMKAEQILQMAELGMVEEIYYSRRFFNPVYVAEGSWLINLAHRRKAEMQSKAAEDYKKLTESCTDLSWRAFADAKYREMKIVADIGLSEAQKWDRVIQTGIAAYHKYPYPAQQ